MPCFVHNELLPLELTTAHQRRLYIQVSGRQGNFGCAPCPSSRTPVCNSEGVADPSTGSFRGLLTPHRRLPLHPRSTPRRHHARSPLRFRSANVQRRPTASKTPDAPANAASTNTMNCVSPIESDT